MVYVPRGAAARAVSLAAAAAARSVVSRRRCWRGAGGDPALAVLQVAAGEGDVGLHAAGDDAEGFLGFVGQAEGQLGAGQRLGVVAALGVGGKAVL